MTIAVTGATGRLGNVLLRQLLDQGERVRALVLPWDESPRSLRGLDVETLAGDVRDPQTVGRLVEGADLVYHLASKIDLRPDRDRSIWSINVDGARVVADACLASSARMVHCSSHHALERRPLEEPFDEGRPLALAEPCHYHRSKAHGELAVLSRVSEGLDAVVVSPGTMIGPFDFEPSMIGAALLAMHGGRLPLLLDAVSDYVDVRDVALATIAAARHGRKGERYLLTGEVYDIRQLAAQLSHVTGRPMPKICLPLWAGWALVPFASIAGALSGKEPPLSAGVLRAAVSPSIMVHEKARAELGFEPRPLSDSLRDTFEWFHQEGKL